MNFMSNECYWGVELPKSLRGADVGDMLRDDYARIKKIGVTIATSDREAISNVFMRGFKDKGIGCVKPKTLLRILSAAYPGEGNGIDAFMRVGARAYEIPDFAEINGKPLSHKENRGLQSLYLVGITSPKNREILLKGMDSQR